MQGEKKQLTGELRFLEIIAVKFNKDGTRNKRGR